MESFEVTEFVFETNLTEYVTLIWATEFGDNEAVEFGLPSI